ncbi:MAG: hypothetical protein RSD93_06415 [Gordonibacter sp.]|uniref:baeRF8 domain-containing protein n=1 Tax=Gordonibacter sp. TaxID=1968902 RepID=UPI002FCA1430
MRDLVKDRIVFATDFSPLLPDRTASPAASVYLPLHGGDDGFYHDRILLGNLVAEAKKQLTAAFGKRSFASLAETLEYIVANPAEIVGDKGVRGLGVLATNEQACVYRLPFPVEPRVQVGETFFLKPLLRDFQYGSRYVLLGLSADRFSFIRGSFTSLDRAVLPVGTDDQFSELYPLEYDGRPALDYTTLEGHMSPYHNYRSRDDVRKEESEKFFRYVGETVSKHLMPACEVPVVLVALPEHQALFRRVADIGCLLDEGIEQNVDELSTAELLADAAAVIGRAREARASSLIKDYANRRAHGGSTDDAAEIGMALVERKVRALFVEEGRELPGTFDEATGKVSHETKTDHGERGDLAGSDLADALAQAALHQGGDVYVLAASDMPTKSGAAALFRY